MKLKKVFVIVGPTGVGKTEYSIEFAKKLGGEIISADSMQVYRGMDIGTAKPSLEQRAEVSHHLIDIREPSESFSAADFCSLARNAIEDIIARKKIPVIVGGTGLYINALIDGLFPDEKADWRIREVLYKQAEEKTDGYLYKRLLEVDEQTALKLHPNDTRRIVRALEVYERTGIPISKHKEGTRGIADRYDIKMIGLAMERGLLYQRIEKRVEGMFERGFLEECGRLYKLLLSRTAKEALGYKECYNYGDTILNSKIKRIKYCVPIIKLKDLIKQNTRRYAKRQISWFKRDERIVWKKRF